MYKYLIGLLLISQCVLAQELNARVEVNFQQMKSKIQYDPSLFEEIKGQLTSFMNNTRWTNDDFDQNEKIECNLVITLQNSSIQNYFTGSARFQVVRPIYGTNYKTVTLQYVDQDFAFSFQPEERQMIYSEQSYTTSLVALGAYYSLLALAVDYDSFGKLGGSPYIQKLYNLINQAQSKGGGWSDSDRSLRNRYWLMENLNSQQMSRFREVFYTYHRIVMDDFGRDPQKSREEMMKLLETIQNIATLRNNSVLINSFFDAKNRELVNIFSQGTAEERNKIFVLLSGLDPTNTEIYRKIKEG